MTRWFFHVRVIATIPIPGSPTALPNNPQTLRNAPHPSHLVTPRTP